LVGVQTRFPEFSGHILVQAATPMSPPQQSVLGRPVQSAPCGNPAAHFPLKQQPAQQSASLLHEVAAGAQQTF
jgi:hypothetical protein